MKTFKVNIMPICRLIFILIPSIHWSNSVQCTRLDGHIGLGDFVILSVFGIFSKIVHPKALSALSALLAIKVFTLLNNRYKFLSTMDFPSQ